MKSTDYEGKRTMKKVVSVLMTIILLISLIVSANAERIRVPIDFKSMSNEELWALAEELSAVLTERGYSYNLKDTENSTESKEKQNEPGEENKDEIATGIMDEGAKELSDESFLEDLSAALSARWTSSGKDTTLYSDKQFVKYMTQLVNSELVYLNKYTEYTFIDEKLGEYARAYITALQSQLVGITEYYTTDEKMYNEYWYSNGYYPRARYIYLINKAYGLNISDAYMDIFKDMVARGIFSDIMIPNELALKSELSKLDPEFSTEGKYLYVLPFNFTNSSSSEITSLTVKVNFINDKDVIIDSDNLISYENIESGKTVSTRKVNTSDHFDHITYSYSFDVQTSSFRDTFEGTVIPDIQYSWDGTLKKNGELATGQPVLDIDNLISGWDYNSSWSQTLYVPYLKFDVRNIGTGDANKITVRCVFTNTETKQIWDEETSYVVGSSDSPLKVGYSKKAFVYASVGYKTNLGITPKLTVDIFINEQLADTVIIK